nr:hypothetical protein [Rhodococcus sp. P1Y]
MRWVPLGHHQSCLLETCKQWIYRPSGYEQIPLGQPFGQLVSVYRSLPEQGQKAEVKHSSEH